MHKFKAAIEMETSHSAKEEEKKIKKKRKQTNEEKKLRRLFRVFRIHFLFLSPSASLSVCVAFAPNES